MLSAGQLVQKYFHGTVGPERVYTPKQNFNVHPWKNVLEKATDPSCFVFVFRTYIVINSKH